MTDTPIRDYALLADSHGAALVSREGSVDWLCFRRFDAPSTFARMLDEKAGHWSMRPRSFQEIARRYVSGTLVLETEWTCRGGRIVTTEALAVGPNERGHALGRDAPHALLRRVHCVEGSAVLDVDFSPRPEYGLVYPLLERTDDGLLVHGGPDVMLLCGPADWKIDQSDATAVLRLDEGDELAYALQHSPASIGRPEHWSQRDIAARLRKTTAAWGSWSDEHQNYNGPWQELVNVSAAVMQGLTYYPTGAMVAAPTTSLPERIGGARNWDYRYCWIRDTAFTLNALWVAACPDEAQRVFDFLALTSLTRVRRDGQVQIMYGVGGEHDLTERALGHLSGWRGSRPVLVGNRAALQRQVDVHGELLDAAYRFRDHLREIDPQTREFLGWSADQAARLWREKDHGIWEMRREPQHFVYSKLMCWVALDRAIKMEDLLDADHRIEDWRTERDAVREAIESRGYNQRLGTFVQTFGSEALDASSLVIPMSGFLPPEDPRVRSTVRAVEEGLMDPSGLVYRYRAPDGLEAETGCFLLCTYWLAEAQALCGDVPKARATFERATAYVNDLGLLSEEVQPDTKELIGNFPQALSHIGLVNAAWAIARAEGWKKDIDEETGMLEGAVGPGHGAGHR